MFDAHDSEPTRLLQWVQRQAGVSRRKAQELIVAGEVSIDGRPATDPFAAWSPGEVHRLSLRGHPVPLDRPESRIYRFCKPTGMLCSHDDPFCGNTVGRVLRAEGFIGYSWVGRLDQDAEGLLLVSNDGEFVQAFTHPRYEVEKTYHVWFQPMPRRDELTRMLGRMGEGILDDGELLRIRRGEIAGRPPYAALTLTEGRKHEIKRLLAHFDLSVRRLLRVSVGPVALGALAPGAFERIAEPTEAALLAQARETLHAGGGRRSRGL